MKKMRMPRNEAERIAMAAMLDVDKPVFKLAFELDMTGDGLVTSTVGSRVAFTIDDC